VSWDRSLDELRRRKEAASKLGGEERVARHRAAGKLTVRERIAALLDPESFSEIGSIAGRATYGPDGEMKEFQPANFVMGRGTIGGRPVVVGGDDFTVRAGAADAAIHRKQVYSEQMARELRIPIVRLVDGQSGGGSVKSYEEFGRTYVPPLMGWEHVVAMLAEVPVVAAALGPVVGLGAARMVTSHFSVMVEGLAQVFVAGPPVVAYASRENVDKETLGGAAIHTRNGVVDNPASSEQDAFDQIHRFLSYLPGNAWEVPPRVDPTDDPGRREEALLAIIPRERRRVYDARKLLSLILDRGSFFEIGPRWGRSLVTGLARLDGYPVGVLASDPRHAGGTLTADGSDKLRRFVDLCDAFHVPVASFVDQPGFTVGVEAEKAATIRRGATAIAALYQASVPFFSVIVRRAFGVAGAAFVDRGDPDLRVAWPSGDWGSLPLEGGIEAAFRRQLAEAADPEALRRQILDGLEAVRSPFRTAEAFLIEEIIDPRDTRPLLCDWIRLAYRRLPHDLGPRLNRFRP
jgi:acetyl-CoA carboxylase carboxyltransferase component